MAHTTKSYTDLKKILFEFSVKPIYFSNSKFTVIYTQDIHKNFHTTSLEFIVHIHNMRNSIVK
jgi:hypothetical protein